MIRQILWFLPSFDIIIRSLLPLNLGLVEYSKLGFQLLQDLPNNILGLPQLTTIPMFSIKHVGMKTYTTDKRSVSKLCYGLLKLILKDLNSKGYLEGVSMYVLLLST